jgi:hypothetical protein
LLGEGVNIAVRVEGICKPGGVCLSGAAYEHVRDWVKEAFVDLGEKQLKNIARPVRVYDLTLNPHARASEFKFGSFRLFPDQHLLLDGETPVPLGSERGRFSLRSSNAQASLSPRTSFLLACGPGNSWMRAI